MLNQLSAENVFLRQRVEVLEEELGIERQYSREQAGKITELAADMAQLSKDVAQLGSNAQQLHAGEVAPRLARDGSPILWAAGEAKWAVAEGKLVDQPVEKLGFLQRIFGRRK